MPIFKNNFCAVLRALALGHQGHGRHGRLLCLQTWVKGYMTEFGLVGLIREKCLTKHVISYLSNLNLSKKSDNE